MKILYLTYDGLTDQLGQSQILPYLNGLSKQGYDITVISCEKEHAYRKNSKIIEGLLGSIKWHSVPFTTSPPILSTLFNLYKMLKIAKSLSRKMPFTLIHCRSTLPALLGMRLKNKFGSRLLFDMRGFWADERVEGKLWPLTNPLYAYIYRYVKRKERQLLSCSDHIITLTHEGKKETMLINEKAAPVTVIPCCADEKLFDPALHHLQTIELKRKLQLENAYIITYSGSIGTWYMLDEMLEFFKIFQSVQENAVLLFITNEKPEVIYEACTKTGCNPSSVRVCGAARNEMPQYILTGNATLFFIRKGFSKKGSSPVKLGESLMMGIPVITNEGIGDNDALVEKMDAGWIIELSKESYRETAIKIINNNKSSDSIRKNALDYFSLEKGIASYQKVYETLR